MRANERTPRVRAVLHRLDADGQARVLSGWDLAMQMGGWLARISHGKISNEEAKAEALFGLTDAAARFDATRGVPFLAFAPRVMRHRLLFILRILKNRSRVGMHRFTDWASAYETPFDAPCPRTRPPDEPLENDDTFAHVVDAVPARWFEAMRLYYMEDQTLDEIATAWGISRERVRQLIAKGIKRAKEETGEAG